MPVSEELKNLRGKDYTKPEGPNSPGMDSGEKNSTSRIIKLTDDEQKTFAQANPGDDLACEVHGTLEDDGHLHVMSVKPLGGESYGDDMAGEVAQKVTPTIQPSSSS